MQAGGSNSQQTSLALKEAQEQAKQQAERAAALERQILALQEEVRILLSVYPLISFEEFSPLY